MSTNEHSSPYGGRGRDDAGQGGYNKPAEDTLRTEKIQIERKMFIFHLKENPRGRFLRITEDVGGRRDHIIVPATGLEDFRRVVEELARVSEETPPKVYEE